MAGAADQDRATVERRDVEILHTESARVLVRGTLQEGDQVIVDGIHRVVAGQNVVVKSPRATLVQFRSREQR